MILRRRLSVYLIALLATMGLLVGPGISAADDRSGHHPKGHHPSGSITLTAIGKPTWKPVDLHLFSAPIGTAENGYAEFTSQQGLLLPPPRHVPVERLGIGPGAPHKPPYTKEFGRSIRSLGLHEAFRFDADEFSNGSGVWLVWMAVPRPGVRGSSPDFHRGPIIPNRLFPITVSGSTFRGGTPFSNSFSFGVPPLDGSVVPGLTFDGHSHVPVFFADNRDFGPDGISTNPVGRYFWHMTMVDSSGSGWEINTTFVVKG